MKVKDLLEDVSKELEDEKLESVKSLLKLKEREVRSAKKTLKKLEDERNELLEADIEDLELDNFEY